ncbi:hypothetical protein CLOM_g17801 [Closterium sp. NIES-68]|nr:hypothetical protein CLOM_g17801 [Closterium sp. NIES-68]
MLVDPVLSSAGRSAINAIELQLHRAVPEAHIVFLNLTCAPGGIHNVCRRSPHLKTVTSLGHPSIVLSLTSNFPCPVVALPAPQVHDI